VKTAYAAEFWHHLFHWFAAEGRSFAWRQIDDPFRILIAEILLQKTNAAKVEPVYLKLVRRYPYAQCLAEANLSELEDLLRPLGLRYRAGRLIKCAEAVLSEFGGCVPRTRTVIRFMWVVPQIHL